MKVHHNDPPREFSVGRKENPIWLKDCGSIELRPDEQVTFINDSGAQYDIVRKAWGYYATPSLNSRLLKQGFRTALVLSRITNRHFVMLVELVQMQRFLQYLEEEGHEVVEWLDER